MLTLDRTIETLRGLFEHELKARQERAAAYSANKSLGEQDEISSACDDVVRVWEQKIRKRLQDFGTFLPQHARHFELLQEFHRDRPYDKCVFIMTKFPDGSNPLDPALQSVIDLVKKSIADHGFHPRIASDRNYHPILWDNVELYLLGCKRGVAIVEDRYRPEFNPNVAMEWGWMRGLGRDVLYLIEEQFDHERADTLGLIGDRFSWNNPQRAVEAAIKKWLQPC